MGTWYVLQQNLSNVKQAAMHTQWILIPRLNPRLAPGTVLDQHLSARTASLPQVSSQIRLYWEENETQLGRERQGGTGWGRERQGGVGQSGTGQGQERQGGVGRSGTGRGRERQGGAGWGRVGQGGVMRGGVGQIRVGQGRAGWNRMGCPTT